MFFKRKPRRIAWQSRGKRGRKKKFRLWPRLIRPGFSIGEEAKQGIWILFLALFAVAVALSFLGKAGEFGAVVNNICVQLLGNAKWALPMILALAAIGISYEDEDNFDSANIIGLFLFLICLSSLFFFFSPEGGGVLGAMVALTLIPYVGPGVAAALFSTGIIVSLLLLLNTSLSKLVGEESLIFKVLMFILGIFLSPFIRKDNDSHYAEALRDKEEDDDEEEDDDRVAKKDKKAVVKEYDIDEEDDEEDGDSEEATKTGSSRRFAPPSSPAGRQDDIVDRWQRSNIEIKYPLSLLKNKPKRPTSGNIDRNQDVIKRTLRDFGIPITMGDVRVGPTVTQYTFKPCKGIPIARVKALSDDLAMELSLHPVRIEAPIPGKSLVGLEVPNQTKVLVTLKELIQSKQFKNRRTNMNIALGRDVTGRIWLDDLAKLPHLLVAGATNSGKSIFLHSLITSLLYQNNPDDLKLILIDVKQVELTPYNGLPYLITPVVTENKRAIRALQWCLNEMDRRLEILSQAKCQNIQDYNKRKKRMPYLVVVVDELGDLMSTSRKEAEAAIIRLGQKARAAGIHLILATQRPSVDILSGLIKANMPARISFQVTSGINSKTILDFIGAEKLIGQGDMLYMSPALSKPVRIQGAYVGKDEVNAVVRYAKRKAGKAKYAEGVTETKLGQMNMEDLEVDDELLEDAKEIIFEYNKASASMLQSRLSIGYPRANRILDILAKQGIVGPSIQNKPREVFVDRN